MSYFNRLIGQTVTRITFEGGIAILRFASGDIMKINKALVLLSRTAAKDYRKSHEAQERAELARLKAKYESDGLEPARPHGSRKADNAKRKVR